MRFLLGLAAFVAVTAHAQTLKLQTYTLANGMKVILHEDHALPLVTVNILYRVGSKDEPDRRSGFAHLFEHLMFMGTDRVPTGQYDAIMEGAGGWNNANTTEDRTDFFDVGPSNILPTLLYLEADRLETLGKNMTQKKLDLQRDVVKNERRQTTENTPYGKAEEAINGLMFPPLHPYHTSVIGSMENLDAASVQDVQNFFATYYVPNNASMVIAGDFNPADVKPIIAKLFGTLPRANDVQRKFVPNPSFAGIKRLTMVDAVEASKVLMIWHAPAEYHAGDADLNLAAGILSDGLSSRLYQRLVVKDKLVTDISASVDDRILGSLFVVDATAANGASLSKIEEEIKEELTRLGNEGPSKEELQRQVAKTQFGIVNGLQSVQDTADQLNEFDYFMGMPNGFATLLANYKAVTPTSLKSWVHQTITPSGYLDLRVVPQAEPAQGPDPRDGQPVLGPSKAFAAPAPNIFHLANGLKVEFWQRPNVPLMAVSLRTSRGADADSAAKGGLAGLTAEMLSQGAGTRDAKAFEQALDALGAQFSASVDERSMSATLNVLATNFEPALKLYADAVIRPRFDVKEYDRVKRVAIANIEQENDDPSGVSRRVANREYFGKDHPYGRPVEGSLLSVKSLMVADLKAEQTRFLNSRNVTLYVAGALPLATVKAKLEAEFGSWKRGSAMPPPTYSQPATGPARLVIVDRPGAVQTVVRFMFPAPVYSSPSRQALTSMNVVLGGSFTSRLNHNLREDKGYTYGAGSAYTATPQIGFIAASADVRADVTGASLKEFLTEFNRISSGDISVVEATKTALTRRQEMVNSLESLDGLLGEAEGFDQNGGSFAMFGPELAAAMAVSASDMNVVAKGALPMDHMVLVLVGDKATILKHLDGLKLPTPEFVNP
jgi:predicted Zn-dependent peptidase